MKKLTLTAILLCYLLSLFGQNGLKGGPYFLLIEDQGKISINSYDNNKIKKYTTFKVSEKNIYTTDHNERVAILDTKKNMVTLFDIHTAAESKIDIPFAIKPKSILLNNDNLFIGGEKKEEMLIQYHLKNKEWYRLPIPNEITFTGKSVDDIVFNDSLLIAIDNVIMPKYILFYHLNSEDILKFSHSKVLKYNGGSEGIHQGRITKKYLGLNSRTYSGYIGGSQNITIYDDLDLTNSFALSANQQENDYHTFTDFLIYQDKILIASKEKGFGIFKIKNTYFKKTHKERRFNFNPKVKSSKIKYKNFKNEMVIKLTFIPNTEYLILTLEDKQGKIRHEMRKL